MLGDGKMAARKDGQMEVWQTGCMRWTENPINEVRLLELPLIRLVTRDSSMGGNQY